MSIIEKNDEKDVVSGFELTTPGDPGSILGRVIPKNVKVTGDSRLAFMIAGIAEMRRKTPIERCFGKTNLIIDNTRVDTNLPANLC